MTRLKLLRSQDRSSPPSRSERGAPGKGAGRVNWRAVLEKLPRQFKASQIRTVRGLKNKRSSEIFGAITRWMEAGAVKRRSAGSMNRYNKNLRTRRDTLDLRAMIERNHSVREGAFRPRVPGWPMTKSIGDARIASRERMHF
jgi:hypothetical protein